MAASRSGTFISMILQFSRQAFHGFRTQPFRLRNALLTFIGMLMITCTAAQAQHPGQRATITPNYKDADLEQITEAVSTITGKTFIIDPRVKAQVTMLSSTPMSPEAFYQAYLSILQVHGYIAVPTGNIIKIIPEQNTRTSPSDDLPDHVSSTSDELVTQVISVHNVSAAQLVALLRPLTGQNGNLAAYAASNMLIITDHANNVNRLMRIIERIDRASDDDVEVIQLQNATAAEIVKVINSLNAGTPVQPGEGQTLKIVADDRTNSILISGDKSARLRIKTLIAYLDTPLQSGGNTQVRYLHYADAEDLAKKLKEQIQGITQATTATAGPGGGAPAISGTSSNSASIWADKGTNALIVSAPPKVMQQIMAIVDKLDIPRLQVHVEAIVAEVDITKTSELGVNWAIYGNGNTNVPAAVFSGGTTPITNLITGALSGTPNIPNGTTLGVGRLVDSGLSFAAILRALRSDGNANIVSTPSVVMLDNEEATINVSQEVPFLTGSYSGTSTTGGASNSFVNPFQTVQRQDVGTKLKITPQINEGDSLILSIDQDASTLSQDTGDAGSKIVNKREIKTKVMVEDGGIIVIGGLLEDNLNNGEDRVPVLGSIPIIGNLFRARHTEKRKNNLMVFIRPTILRNAEQSAIETNAKYNMIRNLQLQQNSGKVPLQSDERQPLLPKLESKPVGSRTTKEKVKTTETPPATDDKPANASPATSSDDAPGQQRSDN
ncbi:MAG TPA: type II secretion system secretin GspD [Steroidobacteraceae bacterium]|nr:type II secretion system secretin GspD [Steroidobacteraceae bacterium]